MLDRHDHAGDSAVNRALQGLLHVLGLLRDDLPPVTIVRRASLISSPR
jgi:hypothetical protein